MRTLVLAQITVAKEALLARRTHVATFLRMNAHMNLTAARLAERFVADITGERPFERMRSHMTDQASLLDERFVTVIALIWPHVGVLPQMIDQI